MTKTNAKSSRWIIEIRGKDHDEVVAELKLVVEYIEELYEVSASMDREIDFSKASKLKPLRFNFNPIRDLVRKAENVTKNWDGGDLAKAVRELSRQTVRARQFLRMDEVE